MKNNLLTVFTPTFNRAYILPKLYNSLKSQSVKEFFWLIVDDGSNDNTAEIVNEWQKEGIIDITYIRQENGGKMSAHNNGVLNAKTELFVCVDSDDFLVETAVQDIVEFWESQEVKSNISGIVAYKGSNENLPIGNEFPLGITSSTLSGLYEKGFSGDTTLVFRTEILKEHLFPIIGKEKFITEAFVYDQIDRANELLLLSKVLTVCEYRDDGLTNNYEKVLRTNPCGYSAFMIQKGNFAVGIKAKFIAYAKANRFRNKTKGVKMPVKADNKFLYNLAYPLGLAIRLYKNIKYRKKG